MKSILSLFGVVALTGIAAPALAQDDSASVDVIGNAEAICTLPTNWTRVSSAGTAASSQFEGNTWTIPAAALANSAGIGTQTNDEYAIRVRGAAMCNTGFKITLRSQNGGLVNATYAGATPPPPPSGFTWKRRMTYNANWQNDVTPGTSANPPAIGANNWGVVNFIPQSAGDSRTYSHNNTAPPGIRNFDIRMGVLREATSGPLLAGLYQDIITVDLTTLP
jgi:hypothetical protein